MSYDPDQDRLYDVKDDPEMSENVIKEHPLIVKEMNMRIQNLWKEYGLEYQQPKDLA